MSTTERDGFTVDMSREILVAKIAGTSAPDAGAYATPEPYSLWQMVWDGPVLTKRWIHHLAIKLGAQHTLPAYWMLAVFHDTHPIAATTIGALAGYAYISGKKLRADLAGTRHPNWPDWFNDLALAVAPIVGGFIAARDYIGAACLLGACAATWAGLHKRATP